MRVDQFDFVLPEELIAQVPLSRRDKSRLLVVGRDSGVLCDQEFPALLHYLRPEDVLVLNDTRVLPARLQGKNSQSQGTVEVLLLRVRQPGQWEVLVKPGKRAKIGAEITFSSELSCEVVGILPDGQRLVRFECQGDFFELIQALGQTPLPPYIHEKIDDPERYQTVYARDPGSAAAPTAGLHFTPELLAAITKLGVAVVPLTLHVGLGTFRPVKTELVEDHLMHEEFYVLPAPSAATINERRKAGGRVVAVGTTSVRVLESIADPQGFVRAASGWTDIFIYPGYAFKTVDILLTNFHLPRSSLLMLVAAFASPEVIKKSYQHAIAQNYRFFSFGDAMLLL